MRGQIIAWGAGRWIIRPDGGSKRLDVFCHTTDLPPDAKAGMKVEFDLAVSETAMFRAINIVMRDR
jgi:hypothetical protein